MNACSVGETRTAGAENATTAAKNPGNAANGSDSKNPRINVQEGGPADTVRAFYQALREKKFRQAIFLTNLRPAIEGLTDTELNDFSLDFATLAGQVPAELDINGEIITGDQATVTANLPNEDGDKKELQQIKLRREGTTWIIQTVDDAAAARIKKEGKQYFYNLRIETHEDEARQMLDRISKAEMANALQNGGGYTDFNSLIGAGLLPDDVLTSASTGYNYKLDLASDKKMYSATATPAEYGKSGKLSFRLALDPTKGWRITSTDAGVKAMAK